ncbi:hypothetical protein [Pseudomonas soli]|uniref:hypothetical protein n=1 Tax=Pseudomonas soli TaxID=1306993 RepID=UPI0011B75C08|nr:hypothetical protein [Pseudomonas soli]
MKVLGLFHIHENVYLDLVRDKVGAVGGDINIVQFTYPNTEFCSNLQEVIAGVEWADVVVYFYNEDNSVNTCLIGALREATRLNRKVICIQLEDGVVGQGFEAIGDCLVNSIEGLEDALSNYGGVWESHDGDERKVQLKRFKCGSKE